MRASGLHVGLEPLSDVHLTFLAWEQLLLPIYPALYPMELCELAVCKQQGDRVFGSVGQPLLTVLCDQNACIARWGYGPFLLVSDVLVTFLLLC